MCATVINKPKVAIDPKILTELEELVHESGQVVLHFVFQVPPMSLPVSIRIWPSTFLYDRDSSHKSELVHIENIVYAPNWIYCYPGERRAFTLVFSGLPKSCTAFDFVEHCGSEGGAFEVFNIQRNESDVYYLEI